MPLRPGPVERAPDFAPPRAAEPLPVSFDQGPIAEWRVSEDHDTGRITIEVRDHEGAAVIEPQQFFHSAEGWERYSILPNDPTSAEGEALWVHEMSHGDWSVRTETKTRLTCSDQDYQIDATLRAWCDEELVREEKWDVVIPRLLA